MHCPLCDGSGISSFETRRQPWERAWHCGSCGLIFKDPALHLSPSEEHSRYSQHQNGDSGHRGFLAPILRAAGEILPEHSRGLDWGSGPVPVLAEMLRESGFPMEIYDPHFSPDLPAETFDFVTSTEVVEHFRSPLKDWQTMCAFLRPGGLLFVMTEVQPDWGDTYIDGYSSWYYRRDPTHLSFYSEKTWEHFPRLLGLTLVSVLSRGAVFRKHASPTVSETLGVSLRP